MQQVACTRANHQLDPEFILWVMVIKRAIVDLQDNEESLRRKARVWLNSDDYHTGSCRWICEALKLNTTTVQKEMKRRLL